MDTDLAWLAGILDGEGTINLHRQHKSRTPVLQVHFYGNDGPLMDKVRKILDGLGLKYSVASDRRTAKLALQFILGTHSSLTLYPLVAPYIVRQVERYSMAVDLISTHKATGLNYTAADVEAWSDLRAWFGIGA